MKSRARARVNTIRVACVPEQGGEGGDAAQPVAGKQNGTRKLLAIHGERLVCVRYRYDAKRQVRHKTVELIVETTRWNPRVRNARRRPEDMVAIRIAYSESELRERVKRMGGIWRHCGS